jgi:hypothetical protein
MADQTGTAVTGLIHVNKSVSTDPLTTIMGSRAFVAVARAVLYVMLDPEEDGLRILAQAKNNLGRMDVPPLKFAIENTLADTTTDGEEIYTGKVVWRGEASINIQEAIELAGRDADDRTMISEAADWLKDYLAGHGGIDQASTIKKEAMKAGIKDWAVTRARKRVGAVTEKAGFQGPNCWRLPVSIPDAPPVVETEEESLI